MNIIDLIIVFILGLSAIFALMRGFIRSAISLASWIVACVASFSLCGRFAVFFTYYFQTPFLRTAAAFSAIFLGVLLAGMLLSMVLRGIIKQVGLGGLDRLLGLLFGTLRGALFVSVLLMLASMTPLTSSSFWQQSTLLPHFNWMVSYLHGLLPKSLNGTSVTAMIPSVDVGSMANSITGTIKSNIGNITNLHGIGNSLTGSGANGEGGGIMSVVSGFLK